MKIKIFQVNPFQMNCYVYYSELRKEGVIIDPAAYTDSEKELISEFIEKNGIKIKYLLNTHGHIDHILGNAWAKQKFNVPLLMHKEDRSLIDKAAEHGLMFGIKIPQLPLPDGFLEEDDEIKFGGCLLNVIHTPGHSPGGICFVDEINKIIFSGDVLFRSSVGRTDLFGGNMNELLSSIKNKLFFYADNFVIYPGHYEKTTIGEEKLNNPFVQ